MTSVVVVVEVSTKGSWLLWLKTFAQENVFEFKSTVFRIQGLSTQSWHYKLMAQLHSDQCHCFSVVCHACGHFNNQNRNMMMVLGSHWHGPTAVPPSDLHELLHCMCLHSRHSHWLATTAAPPSGLHQLHQCMG